MKKEKLVLVPWTEEYSKVLISALREETDNNSWWYLHGQLEHEVGFDKGKFINCKSMNLSRETIDWKTIKGDTVTEVRENFTRYELYADGEFEVEVLGFPDRPAIFVAWVVEYGPVYYNNTPYPHWQQRGLVVFKDDKKALEYARESRRKRANWL